MTVEGKLGLGSFTRPAQEVMGAITLSCPGPELLHNEQVQSVYLGR